MISSTNLLNTVSAMGYDLDGVFFTVLRCIILGFIVSVFFDLTGFIVKGVKYIYNGIRSKFFSKRS